MPASAYEFVSFDLDGTLVELDFSLTVWRKAIPSLVAQQRGISLEEATEWVSHQYETVGEESLEWYDLAYWYERFGLRASWQQTLLDYRRLIRPFPEVQGVLRLLSEHFRMVILSNASRPFVQAEMEAGGLQGRFEQVISATSDLGQVKKTQSFYRQVCRMLGVAPSQVVHVGDHWEFDYLAPRKAGLQAYFIDRSGRQNGRWVVKDLESFAAAIRPES